MCDNIVITFQIIIFIAKFICNNGAINNSAAKCISYFRQVKKLSKYCLAVEKYHARNLKKKSVLALFL